MKNLTPSELHTLYAAAFREYFNQYMAIRDVRPFEDMTKFRVFLFRLGMLVEFWAEANRRAKEKSNG